MKYFSYLGSMTTTDARCIREIESRIFMAKTAFNTMIFHQQNGFNL
jgi:hypothetical protein